MRRPRRNHSALFKSKVALAAIRGDKNLAELAEQFEIHPTQVTQWKAQLLERAAEAFGEPGSAAVKEVERAASIGLIGVMLAAHAHGKNLGEPEFYPLYAACERLDMPVAVHAAQQDCEGLNRFTSFIGVHSVSHPFEQMVCATGMILGGIPELFPRLRIAYLEAGCGWVPYWMWRLDEEYEKRKPEAPLLKARPSEYMRSGRIFYSCDPDEEMIDYVMDRMGEAAIFYASDYPHWDALHPNSVKVLMENRSLGDKRKKKIFDDNPRRFYTALA